MYKSIGVNLLAIMRGRKAINSARELATNEAQLIKKKNKTPINNTVYKSEIVRWRGAKDTHIAPRRHLSSNYLYMPYWLYTSALSCCIGGAGRNSHGVYGMYCQKINIHIFQLTAI